MSTTGYDARSPLASPLARRLANASLTRRYANAIGVAQNGSLFLRCDRTSIDYLQSI
ncbi:hypothetical protein LC607_28915 [Nostoc sp. CHAB 5824]|nr:hypothetical protein [Nostoc sp. CHAB 5824]